MTSSYRKRKRVVIKPRFYLFIAIFIAILVWITVALVRYFAPPEIHWGRLSTDQEISAIIVREEEIIYSTQNGKFENVAAEGDYIEQGAEVALLYSSDYAEEDYDTLIDVRQKIKNYQEENILKNIIYDELERLDDDIDALIVEVSDLVREGEDRVLAIKEEQLRELMEQRRVFLNENLQGDSTLDTRFLREEVLLEKINNTITHLYAPKPGAVSFFIDGMEERLTQETVDAISLDDYNLIEERILNYTVESNINVGSVVAQDQPIYRLINPNHWYAIIKMPRSKNTLVKGSTCDITFESFGHTLSGVYIYDVRIYGKEAIIVLEFSSDIGPMASLRLVTGNLGRSTEGYVIPIECLTQNGAQPGVWIINADKSETFVPVNVMAQNYIEAIVEPIAETQLVLEEGMKLKKP